jgi:Family of unknown function (DUF5343)
MEQLELVRRESETEESNQGIISSVENGETTPEQKTQSSGKRNPPARNTSRFWFERFLAVIQRQNPTVIDSSFLKQIAPSNEGKLLAQLKFLRVIDDQGRPTDLLVALNMVGQEQKKGFQQIAHEAYSDLMAEIVIEKAVPEDIVNFFIRRYSFTRDKAVYATKFFLYLAEKGSLPVSPELSTFLTEKAQSQTPQTNGSTPSVSPVKFPVSRSQTLRRSAAVERPAIQATINVTLDKDTPKEYWDRVFALLGEERQELSEKTAIDDSPGN